MLGDEAGVDQHLDVLLHCGEADRIHPAQFADRALTVKGLSDDVSPCCVAEREEQPVGLFLGLESTYNHQVVSCQAAPRLSSPCTHCPLAYADCEMDSRLPSGSRNHAMPAPPGAC